MRASLAYPTLILFSMSRVGSGVGIPTDNILRVSIGTVAIIEELQVICQRRCWRCTCRGAAYLARWLI